MIYIKRAELILTLIKHGRSLSQGTRHLSPDNTKHGRA